MRKGMGGDHGISTGGSSASRQKRAASFGVSLCVPAKVLGGLLRGRFHWVSAWLVAAH